MAASGPAAADGNARKRTFRRAPSGGQRAAVVDHPARRVHNFETGIVGLLFATPASADEGAVSFWLPGNYGSFAAVPTDPGGFLLALYAPSPQIRSKSQLEEPQ